MISIRAENSSDQQDIWNITKAAFEGKAYAGGDEQDLIDRLRERGLLLVSLVACDHDKVIGQVSFTKAGISSNIGNWFALGPIAVLPDYQRKGIGKQLIEQGIEQLRMLDADGCILTGDHRYYSQHGFEFAEQHCPNNEPKAHFMLRLLGPTPPQGIFSFDEAFYESS